MGIRKPICKAVDSIASLHAVHKLITARGLDLETLDCLAPNLLRRERLLVLIPWLPPNHLRYRTTKAFLSDDWGVFHGCQLSAPSSQFTYITESICAIPAPKSNIHCAELLGNDRNKSLINGLPQRLFCTNRLGPAYLRFVGIGTIVSVISLVQ